MLFHSNTSLFQEGGEKISLSERLFLSHSFINSSLTVSQLHTVGHTFFARQKTLRNIWSFHISLFDPQINCREVLLLVISLFYRRGNWSSERLSDLLQAPQQVVLGKMRYSDTRSSDFSIQDSATPVEGDC